MTDRLEGSFGYRRMNFNITGVDMLALSTEEDLIGAIVRFAALRKQRRK